jgi:hypothetical protein
MNILFFANTPYHIYLSFLLIQQNGYNIKDCDFIVQHDFEFSSEVLPKIENLTLIRGNLEVNCASKFKRYIEKIKLKKQIELLTGKDYNRLYIFNDAKPTTQYLIYCLKRKYNTTCCYVEDGSALYTNDENITKRNIRCRSISLKGCIKNLVLGKEYTISQEQLTIHGTYPLIDEIYGLFPEFIKREKKIFEISYKRSDLFQQYFLEVFNSLELLFVDHLSDELSLFFSPLIETSDKGILIKQIQQLTVLKRISKRIIIKNHPRQDTKYLSENYLKDLFLNLGYDPLVIDQTISSELVYEFLKSKNARIRNVISGPSTTLITARKILYPNQALIAMLIKGKLVSEIYEKLNIECIYYEG